MNYRPRFQLPPPAEWTDFETLCWGLWKAIWGDDNAQKHGRRGQPQHGVDIFGQPGKGSTWAGVQCKGKEQFTNQKLTEREIRREVKKAKKFSRRLSEYTIATTAPRDIAFQSLACRISDQHKKTGWFRVIVRGWDDIEDLLYEHNPPVAGQFYPLVFGGELGLLLGALLDRLPRSSQFAASASPATTGYPTRAPAGATKTGVPSSAGTAQASAATRVEVKDVRAVLPFLTAVHDELRRGLGENDATTADGTLAGAVDRAVTLGRHERLKAGTDAS